MLYNFGKLIKLLLKDRFVYNILYMMSSNLLRENLLTLYALEVVGNVKQMFQNGTIKTCITATGLIKVTQDNGMTKFDKRL